MKDPAGTRPPVTWDTSSGGFPAAPEGSQDSQRKAQPSSSHSPPLALITHLSRAPSTSRFSRLPSRVLGIFCLPTLGVSAQMPAPQRRPGPPGQGPPADPSFAALCVSSSRLTTSCKYCASCPAHRWGARPVLFPGQPSTAHMPSGPRDSFWGAEDAGTWEAALPSAGCWLLGAEPPTPGVCPQLSWGPSQTHRDPHEPASCLAVRHPGTWAQKGCAWGCQHQLTLQRASPTVWGSVLSYCCLTGPSSMSSSPPAPLPTPPQRNVTTPDSPKLAHSRASQMRRKCLSPKDTVTPCGTAAEDTGGAGGWVCRG